MNDKNQGLEEIELLRDAVVAVVAMARDADGDRVKLAMDILLAGTSQLGTIFQQRCTQLAKQKQSRKPLQVQGGNCLSASGRGN